MCTYTLNSLQAGSLQSTLYILHTDIHTNIHTPIHKPIYITLLLNITSVDFFRGRPWPNQV